MMPELSFIRPQALEAAATQSAVCSGFFTHAHDLCLQSDVTLRFTWLHLGRPFPREFSFRLTWRHHRLGAYVANLDVCFYPGETLSRLRQCVYAQLVLGRRVGAVTIGTTPGACDEVMTFWPCCLDCTHERSWKHVARIVAACAFIDLLCLATFPYVHVQSFIVSSSSVTSSS